MLRGDRILIAAIVVVSLVWAVLAMRVVELARSGFHSDADLVRAELRR